jgi:hypothetical protein
LLPPGSAAGAEYRRDGLRRLRAAACQSERILSVERLAAAQGMLKEGARPASLANGVSLRRSHPAFNVTDGSTQHQSSQDGLLAQEGGSTWRGCGGAGGSREGARVALSCVPVTVADVTENAGETGAASEAASGNE